MRNNKACNAARELHHDNSGAVMIIGLFMALFLVGMLYYLMGIGDAVLFRQRMQDAADAGAFTAALMNARGMNLLVLLNLVMAIIMAVYLALRSLEIMLFIAVAIASAVNSLPFCAGCATPAVIWLRTQARVVQRLANQYERQAKQYIKITYKAQSAIKKAWPVVSTARAYKTMTKEPYSPPVKQGIVFPVWAELPTEDHVLRETCDRAVPYVGKLVKLTLRPIQRLPVVGGKVASFIGRGVVGIAKMYAAHYCGGATDGATLSFSIDEPRPATPEAMSCLYMCEVSYKTAQYQRDPACNACSGSPDRPDCSDEVLSDVCEKFRSYLPHAPEPPSNPPTDRGLDGLTIPSENQRAIPGSEGCQTAKDPARCEQVAKDAPGACRHASASRYMTEDRYVYWYKEMQDDPEGGKICVPRFQKATIESHDKAELRDPIYVTKRGNVCHGRHGFANVVAEDWGLICREAPVYIGSSAHDDRDWGAREIKHPGNCNNLPESAEASRQIFETGETKYSSRVHDDVPVKVFSCNREVRKNIQVNPSGPSAVDSGGRSDYKPPQKVKEEAYLGEKDFQIRSLVYGKDPFNNRGGKGATIAVRGEDRDKIKDGGVLSEAASAVSRIGIAQAEFFWHGHATGDAGNDVPALDAVSGPVINGRGRIEWMWDMRWKARLRRVHFSASEDSEGDCKNSAESPLSKVACSALSMFKELGNQSAH